MTDQTFQSLLSVDQVQMHLLKYYTALLDYTQDSLANGFVSTYLDLAQEVWADQEQR